MEVRPLSSEDVSILALENQTVAGHACKVIVLSDGIDVELLRASISARLPRAPDLCVRLRELEGSWCWVPDDEMDMAAHVVLGPSAGDGDETDLRAAVGRIFQQRLDRSRPLWRIDVMPSLEGGGSALIWRVHHALADGSTAMRMADAVLWDPAAGAEASRRRHADRRAGSGPARSTAAARRRLGAVRAMAREVPQPWHRSPFDGHISARREVAFAIVPFAGLRRVAHVSQGATVNDGVLTVVAGALRRWLERAHGHLGTVRVKVPVSLHTRSIASEETPAEPGNRDSFFCLDVPLGSDDPLERLGMIRRSTVVRKQDHDAEHIDSLMHALARIPRLRQFAERALAHPRAFAVNVSNVPGPRQPVEVLGVPVRALYSLAEIRDHHALRIAVVSLANVLTFGLTADPTLLPDVRSLAKYIEMEAEAFMACLEAV
jgi:diacylglycerol O-acyltransferase / wax synthase